MFRLLRSVWGHPTSRWGLIILGAIVLITSIGPSLTWPPNDFVAQPHLPPCWTHPFGTTGQGQDVLAQWVTGAAPTLAVGFAVGLIVTFVGGVIGITSGFLGGRVDELISLLINVFLVIPGLPLAIILAAYLPSGPLSLIAVLSLTGWSWTARVVRAQTLSLRRRDFISASIIAGESRARIILVEITPHLASILLSSFIGTTIYAIGAQVGLEFLGLGDVSAVTWGTNLYWASNDQALLTRAWWTFVPTGLGIALVGFALALINFGLDEVSNPRLGIERHWRATLKSKGISPSSLTPREPT